MGVSMCSQSDAEQSKLYEFQFAEDWPNSEEKEGTDDDSDYLNTDRMRKSVHLSHAFSLKEAPSMIRRKTEPSCYSSSGKMKGWHRSPVVNREAELVAKQYSLRVMDDTLKHLSYTLGIASSTVEKGAKINKELASQDRVLARAESDMSVTAYQTEQVTETLKGIRSVGRKLKNVIWKKEPELNVTKFQSKTSTFRSLHSGSLDHDVGFSSLSSYSPSSLSKDSSEAVKQTQIEEGMRQLNKALDIMTVQQLDAAWALSSQEARLTKFEKRMTNTNESINRQSRIIKRIIRKS